MNWTWQWEKKREKKREKKKKVNIGKIGQKSQAKAFQKISP